MIAFFFHRDGVASSFAVCTMCCLVLVGCGSTPAPISSRPPPPSQAINYHIVGQGDTLFAIAWRYELSVEALARANGLSHPYRIFSGQRLTLNINKTKARFANPVPVPVPVRAPVPETKATATSENVVSPSVANPVEKKVSRSTQPKIYSLPKGKWRWQWPVKGTVSRQYDTSRIFKGLNIQSAKGRKVGAAAPGVVVYAGQGLRGYGRLLIIKHSEVYLSAYAHNRKMYVKEGQAVDAGQKIAEVGGDPENSGRLYFEIRKNGKPVDPMRLLPRL